MLSLNLLCASISKMCPEVIVSSPCATLSYERFHRNALLSDSRENLYRHFSHESFMTCFRGEGQGEGQSDPPASAVFSNSFSLKYTICQGAIF